MGGFIRLGWVVMLAIASACIGQADNSRGSDTVPENVAEFLKYYAKFNPKSAVKSLFDGAAMDNAGEVADQLMADLEVFKTTLGSYTGCETIMCRMLSDSCRRDTFLMKYENGPVFARFDSYLLKTGKWVTFGLQVSRDVDKICPETRDWQAVK